MSTATDSIDTSLGDGVCLSSLVMLFLAPQLRSVLGWMLLPRSYALQLYFSGSICAASGVSVDLTSTESVNEVLVSDRCRLWLRVLLSRFTLVFFAVLSLLCSWLCGSWWRARNCVIHVVSGVVAA